MLFFKEAGEMKNMNPASDDAQNLVRRLQDYITQNLYTCTNKILRGLGKMYSGGGDITTNIDAYGGEGTAIFVADPVVAEFLGFAQNTDFTESDLEKSILSNLQKFLMELGKGYAFVARQQHIHTEKQDYYIDLVFYNYILKCFVLIDLKTERITHQDVGQMDMYIRMYDELKRSEGDNPTIGIVLCSDTDDDIARYSVMHGNEQLFASKYKLYLPTEEELKAEIETQKAMFYLQQQEREEAEMK